MAHHLAGVVKQNARLLCLGGGGIDLRTGLVGGDHSVKPYPTSQRRLSAAFALLNIGPAKPAATVCPFPPKEASDDKSLRRMKPERKPLKLPVRKMKHLFKKPEGVGRCVRVIINTVLPLQVVKVAAAGVANVRPGYN